MPMLILALLAPVGAWVHLRRHPQPRSRRRTLEVYSGNVGPPLWLDIIVPTVGLLLYRAWWRAGGDREPA